ncbi:hypothetical protein FB451DRAFT_1460665 [Mycena latifolia]|nr:hypothetical protein FB451DRAFT_1460665 [Mycena latifolia]
MPRSLPGLSSTRMEDRPNPLRMQEVELHRFPRQFKNRLVELRPGGPALGLCVSIPPLRNNRARGSANGPGTRWPEMHAITPDVGCVTALCAIRDEFADRADRWSSSHGSRCMHYDPAAGVYFHAHISDAGILHVPGSRTVPGDTGMLLVLPETLILWDPGPQASRGESGFRNEADPTTTYRTRESRWLWDHPRCPFDVSKLKSLGYPRREILQPPPMCHFERALYAIESLALHSISLVSAFKSTHTSSAVAVLKWDSSKERREDLVRKYLSSEMRAAGTGDSPSRS